MADALISPAVGGSMWAVAAGAIALCSGRLRSLDDRKIPLMGVLGAFIFAVQMINFTIPGTGSSGHLGGGMILAVLLGPAAGFITMASVLTVQALFFADGGLLALGSNIVNLGAVTCFLVYPLLFRPLAGLSPGRARLSLACLLSAVVGLQIGSLGVVAETALSGVADLPFDSFLMLMQPIHLAIGLVEGMVTATVVGFIWKVRPEVLELVPATGISGEYSNRAVLVSLLIAAVLCGGLLSGFASTSPDGLEWSLDRLTGHAETGSLRSASSTSLFTKIQEQTTLLPGYGFPESGVLGAHIADGVEQGSRRVGSAVSGLVGGMLTLLSIVLGGIFMCLWQRRSARLERC